jgi:Zn-dependent peptidase ImmA (M78 family)/transcriptional regulator with XRE-family HTH domain
MMPNFGGRLRSARKMAGLSLQELADRMDKPVSRQAISKYEQGKMQPDSNALLSIAVVLGVRPDYFFREPAQLSAIEFRKHARLTEKERARIEAKALDMLERYRELESCLGLDSSFVHPFSGAVLASFDDAGNYAEKLRKAWNLGIDPIPDVVEMLESYHVRVIMIDAPEGFDGLAAWSGDIPVIVFNKNRDVVRRRFTALHELAHLLFRCEAETPRENEKLAHTFAGAFLFPKESFLRTFGEKRTHFTERELLDMKEYFGISVGAIMARARSLDVISEFTYRNFCIAWSKKRIDEPGEYRSKEEPARFRQLLDRAASEEIITMSKAAELAGKSYNELSEEMSFI